MRKPKNIKSALCSLLSEALSSRSSEVSVEPEIRRVKRNHCKQGEREQKWESKLKKKMKKKGLLFRWRNGNGEERKVNEIVTLP